jgi:tRNA threonylcarbamoyladenosine biosynthesis protein TsaE
VAEPDTFRLASPSADDTQALGERLGRALQAGDVVALIGPLGSGKTTFAQGLARGLEVPTERHVASPTFALVNEHPGRVPFVHADFYRIAHARELGELGLEDAFDRAACALEWADRFAGALPGDALRITFSVDAGGGRQLVVEAGGPRSSALLAALAQGGGG